MISKEPAELTVEIRVVEEQEQVWLSGFSVSSRMFLQSQPFLTSSLALDLMKGFMFFFFPLHWSVGNGQRSKGSIARDLKQNQEYQ